MDTGASSHLADNIVHQFTRDNDVSVGFDAYGFSIKDYQTGQLLLRCDSTGDLYRSLINFVSYSRSIRHEFRVVLRYFALFNNVTHSDYSKHSAECSDLEGLQIGIEPSNHVLLRILLLLTSVYTDSEPGRAFWGADDEEVSEGGIPRVIVLGYDGLPIQPVAPPSPDYIPAQRDPQHRHHYLLLNSYAESPEPVTGVGIRGGSRGVTEDDETEEWSVSVRPQTSISLPPEAEVERLLTITTLSPSPPSAGERLARCMALPAHSPPLLPSSGCPTQIQTLRIASTQALIDTVTAALPSPPLPPSLYIPPPVDRRDDILESEQPPRKRLYFSTLGSRYEVGESSTARPTRGQGIDYVFVNTVDAEERRQGIRGVGYGIRGTWVDLAEAVLEIAPMTVREVNTRVIELAELHEHDTQDLYALLEDAQDIWMVEEEAYASREAWAHSIRLSQTTHQELQTHRDHVYAHETHLQAHQTELQLQSTLIQTQHRYNETHFSDAQAELRALRETDRRRQDQMVEDSEYRDIRSRDKATCRTKLLTLQEQSERARQPWTETRIPDLLDALGDADSHI
ncbi:hypothetical protein Tco_1262962 [Tanacetum coccineum]